MVHKYPVPLVVPISEELCEFIGAFIGDGCLYQHSGTGQLSFAGHREFDKDYYENHLLPLAHRLFGMRPSLRFGARGLQCSFYSQGLLDLFVTQFGFHPGPKTFTVQIPAVIMGSTQAMRNASVRGLFDTDGGVGFDKRSIYKKPYIRVNFVTSSTALVKQVSHILNESKIPHSIHSRNNGRQFQFQINGIQSVKRYLQEIGFSNPRHRNKVAHLH